MAKRIKTLDQLVEQDSKLLHKELYEEEERHNRREFEHLQKVYPLFPMTLDGKVLNVKTGKNSSFNPWLTNGHLDHEAHLYLDHYHMTKTLSVELMKLYPDLYISVYASKDGCTVSVWVNRPREDGEPNDAESIGSINIIDVCLHNRLHDWNLEADQAKRNKWFFCSGHQCAEVESQYGYFYFAGKYCKRWTIEHPEDVKRAQMETYE